MEHFDIADLPAVHRFLQGITDEGSILQLATDAAQAQGLGWFARARAIGELQRRADYATAAVARYAKALKMGRSTAFQLGSIDRRILLPRLQAQGDAATFPIRERKLYVVALGLSNHRRTALSIIEFAEEARRKNRHFTARDLSEHYGVHDDDGTARGIGRCLAKLGAMKPETRDAYLRGVDDPAAVLALAEAATKNTRHLATALREKLQENA